MEFGRKCVRLPKSAVEKEHWKRLIVILEHCPLKNIHTEERGWELVSERHKSYHKKNNQDPAQFRPDVVHQCLLHLLDSPLNRAGMLQVFLRTSDGTCIAVDPRLRVPRCMKLFEKMMVQLLYKMKIRSSTGYLSLLKAVKNPILSHCPPNCRIIRVEKDGELVNPFEYAKSLGVVVQKTQHAKQDAQDSLLQKMEATQFSPFVLVIGGMARGDVDVDYASPAVCESVRISDRGMSAAAVCSEFCHAFEEHWLADDNQ